MTNQSGARQRGQNASPVGGDGLRRTISPQVGHLPDMPSGVRGEIVMARRSGMNAYGDEWRGRSPDSLILSSDRAERDGKLSGSLTIFVERVELFVGFLANGEEAGTSCQSYSAEGFRCRPPTPRRPRGVI